MNGTVLGDRYRVEGRIGSGGMAEVYRGFDPVLNRTVAIKILLPQWASDTSFVARFRREAQTAARLNHPNVVAVYDSGSNGDTQWIVMEFIEGRTLHEFLSGGRRPTIEQACEIAGHICGGLAAAHAQGVIHRDIKPANVMVTRDGTVKLMDLGIARLVSGPETAPQTSAILGTASYMSPEQAQGRPVDERTDLYSLGAVLYELLTGKPPFTGDSPVAIAYKQVNESPVPPSEANASVTPQLDAVVMRALSKNPANRYETAREFADDLERARAGRDVLATPLLAAAAGAGATQVISRPPQTAVLPPHEEPPGSGRKVWLGVLIGVLVLAVLGGVGFLVAGYLTGNRDTNDLPPVAVPNVVGRTEAEATDTLQEAGFTVDPRKHVVQDENDVGNVIRQVPLSGLVRDPDTTTVTILVGKAPELVVVPDLTGRTLSEAQALLDAVGLFLGSPSNQTSDEVEAGRIISQAPGADEKVEEGTFVDVVVATGPTTVTIPDVECETFGHARSILRQLGLQVIEEENDSVNPQCPNQNRVAAQDPVFGTQVEPGSSVTLFTNPTTTPSPSPSPSPAA